MFRLFHDRSERRVHRLNATTSCLLPLSTVRTRYYAGTRSTLASRERASAVVTSDKRDVAQRP